MIENKKGMGPGELIVKLSGNTPDGIPADQLGSSPNTPFTLKPETMPYGAWCKCSACGTVDRCTIMFDFYGETGAPMKCESCARKEWFSKP